MSKVQLTSREIITKKFQQSNIGLNDKISGDQLFNCLDHMILREFDREIAEQFYDQMEKFNGDQVSVNSFIAVYEKAVEILNNKILLCKNQIQESLNMKTRLNDRLQLQRIDEQMREYQEDLKEFEYDLQIIEEPFRLIQKEDLPERIQKVSAVSQQSQVKQIKDIDFKENPVEKRSKTEQFLLLLNILFICNAILISFERCCFFDFIISFFYFISFLEKQIGGFQLKALLVSLVISIILDLGWLWIYTAGWFEASVIQTFIDLISYLFLGLKCFIFITILKMIQDEKKLMEKSDVKLPRKSFNRLDNENI